MVGQEPGVKSKPIPTTNEGLHTPNGCCSFLWVFFCKATRKGVPCVLKKKCLAAIPRLVGACGGRSAAQASQALAFFLSFFRSGWSSGCESKPLVKYDPWSSHFPSGFYMHLDTRRCKTTCLLHFPSGWPEKSPNFLLSAKMVLPRNSGSESWFPFRSGTWPNMFWRDSCFVCPKEIVLQEP